MAEELLSYEADVAPMKGSYFPDVAAANRMPYVPMTPPSAIRPTLAPAPSSGIPKTFDEAFAGGGNLGRFANARKGRSSTTISVGGAGFDRAFAASQARAEAEFQRGAQMQDLQYAKSLLDYNRMINDFESNKLELERERNFSLIAPDINKRIDDVFKTKPSGLEQAQEITKIRSENPSFFESKSGNAIYGAASARAAANASVDNERRRQDEAGRGEVVRLLTQYDPEAANKVASGDLTIAQGRSIFGEISKRESERGARERTSGAALDFRMDTFKKRRERYDSPQLQGASQDLATLLSTGGADVKIEDIQSTDPSVNTKKMFKPTTREKYLRDLANLTGVAVEDARKQYGEDDLELYRTLGKQLDDEETVLYRSVSGERFGSPTSEPSKDLGTKDKIGKGFRPE